MKRKSIHQTNPNRSFQYRNDLCYIPLTQGQTAIVNAAWGRYLEPYGWYAHRMSKGSSYYATTGQGGNSINMHRMVMMSELSSGFQIDHRNHDTLDNRDENLRVCVNAENRRNENIPRHNTSGFKGATWVKSRQKWRAQIKIFGKLKHLGYFKALEHAALAYDNAAIQYHKEFARTNKDIAQK